VVTKAPTTLHARIALLHYIVKDYCQYEINIVINDKSKGSVATHVKCGGIFSYHITTSLLPSLPVKTKNAIISQGSV